MFTFGLHLSALTIAILHHAQHEEHMQQIEVSYLVFLSDIVVKSSYWRGSEGDERKKCIRNIFDSTTTY